MSLGSTIASLVFLSAGVALVCLLVVLGVNRALRRTHAGFHDLETLLAHVFGASMHPNERAMQGLFALFLSSWAATLGLFILRIAGAIPDGFVGIALYGLLLVTLTGAAAFPLLGYGVFGRKHHPRAPVWIVSLALVFSLALGICTSLLF